VVEVGMTRTGLRTWLGCVGSATGGRMVSRCGRVRWGWCGPVWANRP